MQDIMLDLEDPDGQVRVSCVDVCVSVGVCVVRLRVLCDVCVSVGVCVTSLRVSYDVCVMC